jgi:hypothetical protein
MMCPNYISEYMSTCAVPSVLSPKPLTNWDTPNWHRTWFSWQNFDSSFEHNEPVQPLRIPILPNHNSGGLALPFVPRDFRSRDLYTPLSKRMLQQLSVFKTVVSTIWMSWSVYQAVQHRTCPRIIFAKKIISTQFNSDDFGLKRSLEGAHFFWFVFTDRMYCL